MIIFPCIINPFSQRNIYFSFRNPKPMIKLLEFEEIRYYSNLNFRFFTALLIVLNGVSNFVFCLIKPKSLRLILRLLKKSSFLFIIPKIQTLH